MTEFQIPFEVAEFERLLQKPNSDPTGLAGFFTAGEVLLTRVPARLDVIGGIADYSGANVCEGVLGRGLAIALQPRTDRTLRIRTVQVGQRSLPVETRIPLDYFETGDRLGSYAQVRELCQSNPLISWAAYIGGSIFTLLKEEAVPLRYGFNLLLLSAVPMNVGIGSSATAEIATLHCLQTYLKLNLSAARLAQLGQIAENQIVGAPCGIMDQITVASGKESWLIHILCRPGNDPGGCRDPAGHRFCRHQFHGETLRGRPLLHRRAHRRLHGQAHHQSASGAARAIAGELSHRDLGVATLKRSTARSCPKQSRRFGVPGQVSLS